MSAPVSKERRRGCCVGGADRRTIVRRSKLPLEKARERFSAACDG